jgi:hypothetical protein
MFSTVAACRRISPVDFDLATFPAEDANVFMMAR